MKKLIAAIIIAASVPAQAFDRNQMKGAFAAGNCYALQKIYKIQQQQDTVGGLRLLEEYLNKELETTELTAEKYGRACRKIIEEFFSQMQSTPA